MGSRGDGERRWNCGVGGLGPRRLKEFLGVENNVSSSESSKDELSSREVVRVGQDESIDDEDWGTVISDSGV